MPKISDEKIKLHFIGNGAYYAIYKETVDQYEPLRIHADGIFPTKLISDRRPSENEEILEYRKKIYEPITKLPIGKAITSLGKIRRSEDWMLAFPKENVPVVIPATETLEQYCTEDIPGFGSIEDWAFGILLKQNVIDTNAVIAVIPSEQITTTEYAKPVPILFNSDQVMYFDSVEKYCILKSKRKCNYLDANNALVYGDRFFYIDDTEVLVYEQGKDGFSVKERHINTFGVMPAFKVKGELLHQYDNMAVNRSRFHTMVPFLNKAATGDSDLEGSKVQHLFPLFWYYQNTDCPSCTGGKTTSESGPKTCSDCGGVGKIKFTPFAHIRVNPASLGQLQNPIPPAGYVERDVAILKFQDELVEKNNYKALAAINMQFLDQTPLAISGEAKQVDREELNNTVYNIAEDLIYSISKAIFFISEWRYVYVVPDKAARKAMLPNIPVPQNYDLLPEDYLMKEVTDARSAKVNPLLIATLEEQLASKKFYNQPKLADSIKLYYELDPLPGYSVDEKMSLISNSAITIEDFIISSYMSSFIKRALRDEKDFATKKYKEQMDILIAYAKEKKDANDTAAQMSDDHKQAVILEMKQNALPAAAGK